MAKKTVEPELGTVQVGIADFQRTRDSVSLFQHLVRVILVLHMISSVTTTRQPATMDFALPIHHLHLPITPRTTTSPPPSSHYPQG